MSSKTERAEKLTLKGRLNIANVQKTYDKIREAYNISDCLNVYLPGTSEIDLAFLQVLYSLMASAHKFGKNISVFIDGPVEIRDLIVKAGFETRFSISKTPTGDDFRIEGISDE